MTAKIPATVVTGFLGAGKTSLIRHVLQNARGRRLALIVNEFGDVGVDGEILRGCGIESCTEDDVVELANGCLCCTVADDFIPTIEALLDRPDPPDHLLIETSGLALPKPLVKAFGWPDIRTRVTVDGVVTVIDAPAVAAGQFAADPNAVQAQRLADDALDHDSPLEELFEEQLGCADLVIVNKTDLVDAGVLDRVEAMVRDGLRPAVEMVRASQGAVDVSVLLGIEAAAEDDLDSRPSHHDGDDDHDHDDFTSFTVPVPELASTGELLARLERVVRAPGVLRVKGFAAVAGRDMRLLVQGVGERLAHHYDREWVEGEPREGRLVVIGQTGFDQQAVRESLELAPA